MNFTTTHDVSRRPASRGATPRGVVLGPVIAGLLSLLLASPAVSADFPPITGEERALTEMPGHKGAPAVVLFKKAELRFMDYPSEASSYLRVNVRLKILTEEGKEYGEVEIPHSGFYRLKKVEGRTSLPDGRAVPLPDDAVFEERRSRSLKMFVTKLVFPAVEVGAILDYTYMVRWDSMVFLEPWYFHSEIPTRLSEITYIKPDNLKLKPWGVQPPGHPLQSTSDRTAVGLAIRVWAENLPGIPDEPDSPPFEAMSSRFMMIPAAVSVSGQQIELLESWKTTCGLYADFYKAAGRKDRLARKQAAALTSGIADPAEKIAALHAFLRDEIRTQPDIGVSIGDDEKVDDVLSEKSGTPIAKALALQAMLAAVKVDSDLVWVADKTAGMVDLGVANPWWFDVALVRVTVDGQPVYLDPVDRSVGFGQLAPYYEGTQGVVFHKSKPEIVDLPAVTPFEANSRRARIELEIDGEGRVTGTGTMELGGHQAWRLLRVRDDPEETRDAWEEYLASSFEGYDVTGIEVVEDVRSQSLKVEWALAQRSEEVLGDEVTVQPSLPIGPVTQPYSLPPNLRRTPVQLLYGKRDELEMTLSWPEGWEIDVVPDDMSHEGLAGAVECRVEEAEAERRLTFHRRFDRTGVEFANSDEYGALRELYDRTARADAQSVVLIRDDEAGGP